MALIRGNLQRALLKHPGLDFSGLRLIGWGAGQFFRDHYPYVRNQLGLEYTVCPRLENHGTFVHGLEVRPIEALRSESPHNTLIVVMTNHIGLVLNQIRELYPELRTVKAISFDEDGSLIDEILEFTQLQRSLSLTRTLPAKPRAGIFVQGLIDPCTPMALAWNRTHFPAAYQCMVTWEHQPVDLIERCRPWLDRLILMPQPENRGHHNRNAVWRSARHGVQHLAEQGIEFAIRCRSDNILSGSIGGAIDRHFSWGMNGGRIAVSLAGGVTNIPFHFTEKAMLSRTEDMCRLWGLEEDPRLAGHHDFDIAPDDSFLKLRGVYPESALWMSYAQRLGYQTETLVHSYEFARDRLLALEPDLSWYSIKQITLFNMVRNDPVFSPANWTRLFTDFDEMCLRAETVSHSGLTINDLHQNRVG